MRILTRVLTLVPALLLTGMSYGQTWQSLTNTAPSKLSTALLLTDGTVIAQGSSTSWWRLTPDDTGSYINGTWSQIANAPSDYDPEYFASAVLPDGRVFVMGGEYNFGSSAETSLGAVYDPVANSWTPVAAPSGFTQVGDAQSVILNSGTLMMGNCCTSSQALLDAATLTWTVVGTGKADTDSEEGWTLLPDGTVLTVDVLNATPEHSERYIPKSQKWISAGSTSVDLVNHAALEIGPGVLRPDGTVIWFGGSGATAVYTPGANSATGTWTPSTPLPKLGGQQLDMSDAPAALLPSGNVLLVCGPSYYVGPSYFYEFDGTTFTSVPAVKNSSRLIDYNGRMLVLPTGQILYTDLTTDVEVYTSTGSPDPSWLPAITYLPKTLTHGNTYYIGGTLLNGVSQGAMYGDDDQQATNYPLVRITNTASGHVVYARTHNHTSMAVQNHNVAYTKFDVPSGIETGPSTIEVVASGLSSLPVDVTIQ